MTFSGTANHVTTYCYDAVNRLLSENRTGDGSAETRYTYDADGNLLTRTVSSADGIASATYQYDLLGQLVLSNEGGIQAAYAYNVQGIRTEKTTSNGWTQYLLDAGNVIGEQTDAGLVTYLRGVNLILRTDSAGSSYYLFNAHGDVTELTDSGGAVTKAYRYDAFGVETSPDPQDENPFRYCGEYFDTETGTYYLRARYYAPNIGRFTQQDTHWNTANSIYGDNPQKINEREDKLGLKTYSYAPQITAIMQSGNLYVYCGNSPVIYADPTGNEWYHWVIGGLIVAATAAAVVITAGGAVPALYAISAVACGTTAATTASTIAAGAFIGSSISFGISAISAAEVATSVEDFAKRGNWWVVISAAAGGGLGGLYGYSLEKDSFQKNVQFSTRKLQHEYKHAGDYGISGNWNSANGKAFEDAIRRQMDTVAHPILGTYRGNIQVYHFFNPKTGVDTMIDIHGNFVAGWRLSPEQIECLLRFGNVQ